MKKVVFAIFLAVSVLIGVSMIFYNGSGEQEPNVEPVVSSSLEDDADIDTFSRPEERGEDLSLLETSVVVTRLVESQDKIERRKAAKVLGDRNIAGTLKLSGEQKQAIHRIVGRCLEHTKASNANDRVEARQQIERMWRIAAPTLLENVTSRDMTVAEAAVKSLILMRDESIVKALIEKAESAEDERDKAMIVFALKKMTEPRKSLIPGRECLDEEKSKVLYERLVAPALEQLGE